jgi:RimJ/RimL family protein N-acetyltransferase
MIRGDKCILRPTDVGDAERFARWLSDDEVIRYLPFEKPTSLRHEEEFLVGDPGPETRFCIDTFQGRHIGYCALRAGRPIDRSSLFSGLLIGEKDVWGQGYGTDATISLCMYGFAHQNLNRIWLKAASENVAALRCYEKAGFHREGVLREDCYRHGRYWDMVVMGMLCSEFQTRHPERWPSDD